MAASNKIEILPEDILTGISAVISINVADPPFNSQAKTKLSGPEIKKAVYDALVKEFNKFIKDMSEEEKKIISDKIINNAKVRSAAEVAKATKRKSLASKSPANLPSKLKECDLVGDDLAELYLVEGDSACFHPETKIRLTNGNKVTIKELYSDYQDGKQNYVYSYDPDTNELKEVPIEKVRLVKRNTEVKKYYFGDGSYVVCTPDHEFMMSEDCSFKEIRDISVGEKEYIKGYIFDDVNNIRVNGVYQIVKIEDFDNVDVYDLTVPPYSNYMLANGVIVHNCNTVMAARDSTYQAILPLRGKVLNVMKLDLTNKKQRERFNSNAEIDDMIKALGAGVGDQFDLDKIRYGKVIFAADSDIDGMDICVLLLGIFYRLFRPMIEDGRVYQCCSPLFEIKYRENGKDKIDYAMNDKERIVIEERLRSLNIKKYEIMRAKGLGELNADTFHNYVLSPKNRRLIRISIEDAKKASDMLELAIGNRPADDRKAWMLENTEVIEDLGLYN